MKALSRPTSDVGVIVGRFQVHELHEAHRALIQTVRSAHDRTLVFIGLSPLRNTTSNPLDFNSRKRMFQETYPDLEVYYVEDSHSDELWSANLDREIGRWCKPYQTVTLYGSRDSFISHYNGKYNTIELESDTFISGTEIRRRIGNSFPSTKEFRAGVIAASFNRYPTVYTTVDVAVLDPARRLVLLGKKAGQEKLRFIGGFADVESSSFEADARREVMEEAGIEVGNLKYLGSILIDDWRYRNESDKIKTLFFTAEYSFGRPTAGDDIESVQWVSFDDLIQDKIELMPEHRDLHLTITKELKRNY